MLRMGFGAREWIEEHTAEVWRVDRMAGYSSGGVVPFVRRWDTDVWKRDWRV